MTAWSFQVLFFDSTDRQNSFLGQAEPIAYAPYLCVWTFNIRSSQKKICRNTEKIRIFKITLVLSILWNALIFAITPLIVRYSAISPGAKTLVIWLVLINNIFNGLAYPFAGSLGNGLRAAGDVRFTMIVSISLTIGARLLFSALFGLWLGWGIIGVAIGMSIDLVFRGAIFLWRLRSQKWTQFQVI